MIRTLESPGFVDLQVNGFGGVDFNDPGLDAAAVARAIAALRRTGVTRFLPTLITGPADAFAACARTLASVDDPAIAGIHLEGPYLSPDARGVHPAEHLAAASVEDFQRRQEAAGGRIVLVTLAPEVPGARALIEHLVANGIRVALGHTAASAPVVRDAIAAGATLATHLGNGTPAIIPRHPNFLWEQLASDQLTASVIADGLHLPPSMLKVIARAKGAARTVLVTDAVAAAGQPPGPYVLGGIEVDLHPDGRVTLRGGTKLAGSAITMPGAIATMVAATGLPLEDVVAMASTGPAAYLGIQPAGTLALSWDGTRLDVTPAG